MIKQPDCHALVPAAFDANAPTPARELVLVIAVQDMTGRAAPIGGTD